jgi:hypothetical protein
LKASKKLEDKEKGKSVVSQGVLALLIFVVVGSAIFQVIQAATSSSLFG